MWQKFHWLPAWGKIRILLRFSVLARVRFYTKRGTSTGYRFLGFAPLYDILTALFQEADSTKSRRNIVALAQEWQAMVDSGRVSFKAALARELDVSRARVAQVLDLLDLSSEEQLQMLALGDPLYGKQGGIHSVKNGARRTSWAV